MEASHAAGSSIGARAGFWRRWFGFERLEFASWELGIMRALFAFVVLRYTSFVWPLDGHGRLALVPASPFASQPQPVGLAGIFDFTFLHDPSAFAVVRAIFFAGVLLYAAGLLIPFALTAMLFANVAIATLNVSQGAIGHSGQVIGIPLLLQTIAIVVALAPRWGGWRNALIMSNNAERLLVDWTRQAVVAVYVVTGCTKLIATQGEWIARGPHFVLQMEKAQTEALHDTGRTVHPFALEVTEFLGAHPWSASALLAVALVLELSAPLMLVNRRLSAIIGLFLLGFHLSNGFLMNLPFAENQWMLIIFFINIPFWVWMLWNRLVRSRSG